jgi:hypothetical protein
VAGATAGIELPAPVPATGCVAPAESGVMPS